MSGYSMVKRAALASGWAEAACESSGSVLVTFTKGTAILELLLTPRVHSVTTARLTDGDGYWEIIAGAGKVSQCIEFLRTGLLP